MNDAEALTYRRWARNTCAPVEKTQPLEVAGISRARQRIVALVPACNEEDSIAAAITSLLAQDRPLDEIIVIPNGCTDRTAEIARQYPVTVLELPKLSHRKSEALNLAWQQYAADADIVVGLDGDSELPPFAVGAALTIWFVIPRPWRRKSRV